MGHRGGRGAQPAPARARIVVELNSTVSAQAFFAVPVDGNMRSTKFRLRDHPEIAAWLLSFLDYLLCKQGKLPGDRRIADPPDGRTRAALIEGGVLLAGQRPDGGLALQLNPDFGVRLSFYARVRGEPARNTLLNIGDDPELIRWLLTDYVHDRPLAEQQKVLYRDWVLPNKNPPLKRSYGSSPIYYGTKKAVSTTTTNTSHPPHRFSAPCAKPPISSRPAAASSCLSIRRARTSTTR